MHLHFLHVFSWVGGPFFSVLIYIPLPEYPTVYLSIHLLKNILVAFKFLAISNKHLLEGFGVDTHFLIHVGKYQGMVLLDAILKVFLVLSENFLLVLSYQICVSLLQQP